MAMCEDDDIYEGVPALEIPVRRQDDLGGASIPPPMPTAPAWLGESQIVADAQGKVAPPGPVYRVAPNDEERRRLAADQMLRALGIKPDDEFHQHALVFAEALQLIKKKQRGYQSNWRRHGYLGSVLKLDIKSGRLMNLLWHRYRGVGDVPAEQESAEDTFLDLINYAVFGIQQFREGDDHGRG